MNLLIEFFASDDHNRNDEYVSCLRHNINNPIISKIHIFVSDNTDLNIESDKLIINNSVDRPSYKDLFDYCNTNLNNEICIISNGDIMFDSTLSNINLNNIEGKFLALSRWDIRTDGSTYHYDLPYSQDCWIFKSPTNIKNCDFKMGALGCDNRITYLAHRLGLMVTNPSKQIITKHLHLSNFRTISSDPTKTIQGTYLFVDSSSDMNIPSENIIVSPENLNNMVNLIRSRKIKNLNVNTNVQN